MSEQQGNVQHLKTCTNVLINLIFLPKPVVHISTTCISSKKQFVTDISVYKYDDIHCKNRIVKIRIVLVSTVARIHIII